MKRRKRTKAIAHFLVGNGAPVLDAWKVALSGKGWWRLSDTFVFRRAMSPRWFETHGLVSLAGRHAALQPAGNRRVR